MSDPLSEFLESTEPLREPLKALGEVLSLLGPGAPPSVSAAPRFYVEPNCPWPGHGKMWAHLVTDGTEADLLQFAERLGLDRRWIQKAGEPDFHFDITESFRLRAVRQGAVEFPPQVIARLVIRPRREDAQRVRWAEQTPPELAEADPKPEVERRWVSLSVSSSPLYIYSVVTEPGVYKETAATVRPDGERFVWNVPVPASVGVKFPAPLFGRTLTGNVATLEEAQKCAVLVYRQITEPGFPEKVIRRIQESRTFNAAETADFIDMGRLYAEGVTPPE